MISADSFPRSSINGSGISNGFWQLQNLRVMASTEQKAIRTASCEVAARPDPIKLCMFTQLSTAAETIERTAQYAKDPESYLRKVQDSPAFENFRDKLHVPTTIDKDKYGDGEHKRAFQTFIAQKVLGKQHGLFFITGVQAQLAALKIYCQRSGNNRVAWHVSSHLESAEELAYQELYNLELTLLGSDPDSLPTVEEIDAVLKLPPEQRPAAILLEIPNRNLGCKTYSFAELERISISCRASGVRLHCDGARLWEIEPYFMTTAGKTFSGIATLFDSVYVSFYKGLGGATGAMLSSNDESFINEAKVWQRRAGGNAFTLMYEVIDCERGYNENIGTFKQKWERMQEIVGEIKAATQRYQNPDGSQVVTFVPESPTCCQTNTVFEGFTADELTTARDDVEEQTNVRVFERLKSKKTVDEQLRVDRMSEPDMGQHTAQNGVDSETKKRDAERHFMEWMLTDITAKIDTQVFVQGYVALCQDLLSVSKG